MNSKDSQPTKSSSSLYWRAYQWAWRNPKWPSFTSDEKKYFKLDIFWAYASVLAGFGFGVAVTFMLLGLVSNRVSPIIYFPLLLCAFFAVAPTVQAGVIWFACKIQAANNNNTTAA